MNERIWDKFLTERDKAVFAAGGFGARAGFGDRPALLVVDVNWAFCGERPEPILESIKRWRTSCGEESWVALEYIKQLIEAARAKGLPVTTPQGSGARTIGMPAVGDGRARVATRPAAPPTTISTATRS
jgi:maleamate amidohydrolase